MGIISTDLKVAIATSLQGFPNSGKGLGVNPPQWWESGILLGGRGGGVLGEGNLRRSDFDDSNLFQS